MTPAPLHFGPPPSPAMQTSTTSPSPCAQESNPPGLQVCQECKMSMPCSQGKQSLDGHWYCHACWQAWQGVGESQNAPVNTETTVQAYDTSLEVGQYRYKRWTMPVAGGQQMGSDQIIEAARKHGLLQGSVKFIELTYVSGELIRSSSKTRPETNPPAWDQPRSASRRVVQ